MDIESATIVRLVEQFLKEHNLHRTLETLQEETGITINTVDNVDTFKNDIVKGRWDTVLASVEQAGVAQNKLVDLYEHIIIELVELRDMGPARALLRQTEPMEIMRTSQPERYLKLEQLMSRTSLDLNDAFRGQESKESRRLEIANSLVREVSTAPPSRLLTLLGYSIQWQKKQGIIPDGVSYDLFYGRTQQVVVSSSDQTPSKLVATIKFPKSEHPNSLAFSPDGKHIATGSVGGFVEFWSAMTGKIADDLDFQAKGALMMMEGAVTSLAFSHSGDLVCAGADDGKVKVWKLKSGSIAKRFPAAHGQRVTSVTFSKDDTQILSGGADGTIRIHGLKSGGMLRELRGHTAGITSVVFTEDMSRIVSTSDDGSLRIWEVSSGECLHAVLPGSDKHGLSMPGALSAQAIPGRPTEFVVCTKSPTIYIVGTDGQLKKSFDAKQGTCNEFLAAAVMPRGKLVLAVSDASTLHSFDIETGLSHDNTPKIADPEIFGMACHPSLNLVAFFSNDRRVPIWAS
ncbi:Serine/threonine-protein kinase smu1 [Coemansia aciculifera]|uniref:Serine/threonine-protein kinase smu1 n=1 Tax=Coemansia aciculifera TaxID=417176 RepID=A0ACC1M4M5_9FUNG|nr:Serine/threonine-protein kinase smu1 [Coemansia aciculifera]